MNALRKYIDLVEWAETARRTEWESLTDNRLEPAWERLPERVRTLLKSEFPHMEDLTRMLCPDAGKMRVLLVKWFDKNALEFDYSDRGGDNGILSSGVLQDMVQIWNYDSDLMHVHSVDTDNQRHAQPLGFATVLLRNLLKAWRRLGVRRITMAANKDGGYMWAKFGFLPYPGEMRGIETQLAEKAKTCPDAWRLFDVDDPKSIWAVARHPQGRELLQDCVWKGYFDLDNPEQLAQLAGKAADFA